MEHSDCGFCNFWKKEVIGCGEKEVCVDDRDDKEEDDKDEGKYKKDS
jgi:hypothetical protein